MAAIKPEGFRVALAQMRSGRDPALNYADAELLIRQAADRGAHYVQTPENTLLMEAESAALFQKIAPEDETPEIARFAALAAELGLWLHIGSIAVKVAEARAANRSFLFTPDGGIAARYDKIHMFDVTLPGGETYRESRIYQPGRSAIIADLPWGGLGFTTCYDLRFPEQYKALAEAGARFLAAPSAFTRLTGEAHWRVLIRARAIENGCFVFAAAQGGRHESGRATFGHSLIVSPWGDILGEGGDEPGLIVADIDPTQVDEARGRIPSLSHACPFNLIRAGTPVKEKTHA
jgi:predicted amidohydrolase